MDLRLDLLQDRGSLVNGMSLQAQQMVQFGRQGMGLWDDFDFSLWQWLGLWVRGRVGGNRSVQTFNGDWHWNVPVNVDGVGNTSLDVHGIGNGDPLDDCPVNRDMLDHFDGLFHGADDGHLFDHLHISDHGNFLDHLNWFDHLDGLLDDSGLWCCCMVFKTE